MRDWADHDRQNHRLRRVTRPMGSGIDVKCGVRQSHGGFHGEHRFRAGGSRRTAGKPHAVQSAISGKRDFFLEGRGLFDFARTGQATSRPTTVTPQLFYSRRIGLNGSRSFPLMRAHVHRQVGRYGIGIMNIATRRDQSSATPRTDFTVVRVKRDIPAARIDRFVFTDRTASTVVSGASNAAYIADAGLVLPEREPRRVLGTL